MADEFDRFLVSALAPRDRDPDRKFVTRVPAHIALEDRLAAQQRALAAGLVKQLLGLFIIAAAVWWLGRAAPVVIWFAESPALALGILLTAFVFLVGILSFPQDRRINS